LVLSLAAFATANESVISDTETSSAVFVSDNSNDQLPGTAQPVEGSLVFIEDTSTAPAAPISWQTSGLKQAVAPVQADLARGDLKVLSNPQQQVALEPIRATTLSQVNLPQATNPPMVVQPVAAPAPRELAGDIQIAVHHRQQPSPQDASSPSVAELLITAHQLSHQAESEADYSLLLEACAEAIQLGASEDRLPFAKQLSSWAYNRRGQLRAEAGKQELANADFQAALDFSAKNWRALHNRGVSYAQAGQFAEAFDDFNGVLQRNPKHAKAYANRATLYVQAKDLQSAIKDYQQAIEQDSQFATAHVGLGRVYHRLGQWDTAIEHFTAAIELKPSSADIVCSRGDLQADMGNYGEALADYALTIELDPEFAHAYRNGAWLLATCPDERYRDPENAILGAQQALEYSYGEQHIALDTLAAALASDGQFESAIKTATQAVDLAPENTKVTYLARLQLYQAKQPFRTEPVDNVAQASYEASDE